MARTSINNALCNIEHPEVNPLAETRVVDEDGTTWISRGVQQQLQLERTRARNAKVAEKKAKFLGLPRPPPYRKKQVKA